MALPNITLLGTGLMGFPMSVNLRAANYPLSVWNRSANKAAPLAEYGATVATNIQAAVADAEYVISMLADGPTVQAVVGQAIPDLRPATTWIDMSSTKPEEARATADQLSRAGHRFLDAPVSGGTKGAEAAALAIMVGGDKSHFAAVETLLSALGRPVHVGPTGSGQLSKLANQAIVANTIGAVAEAMLLLRQGGADPAAVRNALKGGFADSTILQQHGARMTNGDFKPGGLTKFQLKDLDNALAEASSLGLSLPSTQSVRDRFDVLSNEMDGAELDHSGLFLELLQRNGLES